MSLVLDRISTALSKDIICLDSEDVALAFLPPSVLPVTWTSTSSVESPLLVMWIFISLEESTQNILVSKLLWLSLPIILPNLAPSNMTDILLNLGVECGDNADWKAGIQSIVETFGEWMSSRFLDVRRNVSEDIVLGLSSVPTFSINSSLKLTPRHPMGRLHPSRYIWRGK